MVWEAECSSQARAEAQGGTMLCDSLALCSLKPWVKGLVGYMA